MPSPLPSRKAITVATPDSKAGASTILALPMTEGTRRCVLLTVPSFRSESGAGTEYCESRLSSC